MPRSKWARYVHPTKHMRWAVGEWRPEQGQYTCPLTESDRLSTGSDMASSRDPDGLQYIRSTKRAALTLAARLYKEVT